MSVGAMLTETVEVQSLTTSQNDMGGISKTFATRIASLSCMICKKTVSEVDQFGKRTARNTMMLYCEYSTANAAIDVKDRVVWGTRTFEVRTPYNPAGKDVLLQIEIEEID
jgi:hypothetical protein